MTISIPRASLTPDEDDEEDEVDDDAFYDEHERGDEDDDEDEDEDDDEEDTETWQVLPGRVPLKSTLCLTSVRKSA